MSVECQRGERGMVERDQQETRQLLERYQESRGITMKKRYGSDWYNFRVRERRRKSWKDG
ncbi:hypothetical protein BDV28DRAFT_141633 [Aspergillus coremiiformis]|uniref:Uncharacterized protein n=1 Tax=Aspergillus coremiiformis TaxID=138285 RepID=A0A5N6YWC1_9EURO|nr:hypothetical protein BDV28DRAFT_141633 [Aspergillus coremiiformis]